ncbi:FAD-binding protein [bacterium]|nr:FAD-binding protein [bacterium]
MERSANHTSDDFAGRIRAFYAELKPALSAESISTAAADRLMYSFDGSKLQGQAEVVVTPATQDEAVTTVALAGKHGIALYARGAGSGLTGGAVPTERGVVLNLTRLNRIIEIDTGNLTATVEPGVLCGDLDREVAKRGLFYPPSPGSADYSTLGGNIMENAGGMRAYKYGVTRDYVLAMKCVLPSGEVFTTGSHAVKNVTGYDIARLMVGSEGTLAVMLEATLRLIPMPAEIGTVLALFSVDEDALAAAQDIVAAPLMPRAMEFMNDETLKCLRNYRDLPQLKPEANAALLLEADGPSVDDVREQLAKMMDVCKAHSPLSVETAFGEGERAALWDVRDSVSPAAFHLGDYKISEDISVPRNKCLEFVRGLKEIVKGYPDPPVVYGHIGDGTLHVTFMFNGQSDPRIPAVEKIVEEMFKLAVSLKGSLSAEHGIGLTKRKYLGIELSPVEIRLMKALKRAFDPAGILNPGKIFPDG